MKLVDPKMKVMKASPFSILTAESDDKICFKEYIRVKKDLL